MGQGNGTTGAVSTERSVTSQAVKNTHKCCQEGIHFLKVAGLLLSGGFRFQFVPGKQDRKTPDTAVEDVTTGGRFYIEVTHLEKKEAFKLDEKNVSAIGNACFFFAGDLLTSVQVVQTMDEAVLKVAIELIKSTAGRAQMNSRPEHISNESIEVAFAPADREPAFELLKRG